jgi:hypothetical protein
MGLQMRLDVGYVDKVMVRTVKASRELRTQIGVGTPRAARSVL